MLKSLPSPNMPPAPQPPAYTGQHTMTNDIRWGMQAIHRLYDWAQKVTLFANGYFGDVSQNSQSMVTQGGDIASAGTIKITNNIHRITGNAAISTITAPPDFVGGPIYLLAEGAWTLATGGNIERSGGPYAAGQLVILCWDANESQHHWHVP